MAKNDAVKIKLTDSLIRNIKFDERIVRIEGGKLITEPVAESLMDYYIHDLDLQGLTLRITRNGAKTFVVRKRLRGGPVINFVCGSVDAPMTIAQARIEARKAIADLSNGIDPNMKRREELALTLIKRDKEKFTFGTAFNQYSDNTFFQGFSEKTMPVIRAEIKEGKIKSTFSINTGRDHKSVEKWLLKTDLWKSSFHEVTLELIEKTLRPFFDKDVSTGNKIFRYCRAAWNNANIGKAELARKANSGMKCNFE